MSWFVDNSLSIGRTPLVQLNRVTDGAPATVLAKIEGRNPAYSVKCRIGAAMIWDAEKRGVLSPGKEVVEPTSGNTGIALAFVSAARGYPLTLTMPETMSSNGGRCSRRSVPSSSSPGRQGMAARSQGGRSRASDRIVLLPQQFKNPANPRSTRPHGPEIWDDTDGEDRHPRRRASAPAAPSPACRATSRRRRGKPILSVAVEPDASPGHHPDAGRRGAASRGRTRSRASARASFPTCWICRSSTRSSRSATKRPSSTPAAWRARRDPVRHLLRRGRGGGGPDRQAPGEQRQDDRTVLPDSGERYLSSPLFEGVFDAQGFLVPTRGLRIGYQGA